MMSAMGMLRHLGLNDRGCLEWIDGTVRPCRRTASAYQCGGDRGLYEVAGDGELGLE
jgi:hypothetical protein